MKYSVKMKHLRLTSFLLCALILLLSCPITTIADDTTGAATTTAEQTQTEAATQSSLAGATLPDEVLGPGELPYEDLQALRVEDVARPETVTLAMAQEAQHVNRLDEQETNLHTVIFQNRGGNKTAYVYSQPVKYVTADGLVRDKDTAITESTLAGIAYAMTDNSITAYFAPTTSGGVVIEFAGHAARMIPEGSTLVSTATRGEGDNEILYNNAFGARTVLRYQTQLNGVKEDIILLQNVGKYSFNFLLTTALTPVEANGTWVLTDEAGAVVMTLGEILVKDSAGKTAYGDLTITPRAQGGYIMTVTAPAAFLTAPDTTYPVYIDPTTTVDEQGYYNTYEGSETIQNEYDSIVDVGLYNSETEYQAAIADTNYHRLSANGRVIYKLPDFYADYGLFTNLDPKQIGKVTLYVPFASGTRRVVTTAMPTATWSSETTPTALYDTTLWDAQTVAFTKTTSVASAAGESAINITQIARSWLGYNANDAGLTFNPQYGFAMCNTTSTVRNVIATEASATLGDAYYTVDYDDRGGLYYVQNIAVSKYLAKSDSTTLTVIDDVNAVGAWTLDYQGNGKYIVYCGSDDSYLLQASGRLFERPTALDAIYLWTIESARTGGVIFTNVFTDKVLSYSNSAVTMVDALEHTDAAYTQTTWAIGRLMQSFTVSNRSWIAVDETRPSTIAAIPSNSAFIANTYFTWSSSDTSVATVDASGNVTGEGAGYAYITATHIITGLSDSYQVHVDSTLSDGVYFIYNLYSSLCVGIEGDETQNATDGAAVEQTAYLGRDKSMQWYIHHIGGNNYSIRSVYSGMYLSLATPSTAANVQVIQSDVSTIDTDNIWQIYEGSHGYIIRSAYSSSTSMVLTLPSATYTDGVNLIQGTYQNNAAYTSEWQFARLKDAALLAVPEEYDRSSYFGTIEGYLETIGYTDCYNNHSIVEQGISKNEMLEHMAYSKITLIRTHGNVDVIATTGGSIYSWDFYFMDSKALSASELIIYGSCLTAQGGANGENLINATLEAGARTVIGFEKSVYSTACNAWATYFFQLYPNYCNNPSQNFYDLLIAVNSFMMFRSDYDDDETNGEKVSIGSYVIVGDTTFP